MGLSQFMTGKPRVKTPPSGGKPRCDCGTEKDVEGWNLRKGNIVSCGCYNAEKRWKHGLSGLPLFKTWRGIVYRCTRPEVTGYDNYGGRGIRVFEEWKESPQAFIDWIEENLGSRPDGFSLDRIDVNGNYEPGNLRWASPKTQSNNRRTVRALNPEEEEILRLFKEPIVFAIHG